MTGVHSLLFPQSLPFTVSWKWKRLRVKPNHVPQGQNNWADIYLPVLFKQTSRRIECNKMKEKKCLGSTLWKLEAEFQKVVRLFYSTSKPPSACGRFRFGIWKISEALLQSCRVSYPGTRCNLFAKELGQHLYSQKASRLQTHSAWSILTLAIRNIMKSNILMYALETTRSNLMSWKVITIHYMIQRKAAGFIRFSDKMYEPFYLTLTLNVKHHPRFIFHYITLNFGLTQLVNSVLHNPQCHSTTHWK